MDWEKDSAVESGRLRVKRDQRLCEVLGDQRPDEANEPCLNLELRPVAVSSELIGHAGDSHSQATSDGIDSDNLTNWAPAPSVGWRASVSAFAQEVESSVRERTERMHTSSDHRARQEAFAIAAQRRLNRASTTAEQRCQMHSVQDIRKSIDLGFAQADTSTPPRRAGGPGPSPSAAARPQKPSAEDENFENLIDELKGEFKKLRCRVNDLMAENQRLNSSFDSRLDRFRPPLLDDEQVESSGDDGRLDRCRAPPSKEPSKENVRQTPVNTRASSMSMKDREPASLTRGNSSARVREHIRVAITEMNRQNVIFEKLDHEKKGMLTVLELIMILHASHEDVNEDILLNIVRVLNGLEPYELDSEGHHERPVHMRSEGSDTMNLGMDFTAFHHMMDPEFDLGPEYEPTLQTLRKACAKQASKSWTPNWSLMSRLSVRAAQGAAEKAIHRWTKFIIRGILETMPPIVILLNSIVVGLAADHQQFDTTWETFEYVFVAFYIIEFVLKMWLEGCRGYFRGPDWAWNLFDFLCLLTSLFDVAFTVSAILIQGRQNSSGGAFMIIKILRLSRLARLVRTLRFQIFAELKLMVMGVVTGLRVLGWAIFLLIILIYIVGVVTRNVFDGEPEFSSVISSMFTLFRCWTDGCTALDGTPLSERLRKVYEWWPVVHVLMHMFISIGLFNLIMAIFIDNVVNSQQNRKNIEMVERSSEIERKFKHLFAEFIKDGTDDRLNTDTAYLRKLRRVSKIHHKGLDSRVDWGVVDKEWEVLREMDVNITKEVFSDWLAVPELDALLDEAEIYVANRSELFDVLDVDMGGQLSMDELTTGLMTLRGAVTKADIVSVRLKVRNCTAILQGLIENQWQMVKAHRGPSMKPTFLDARAMSDPERFLRA